MKYLILLAFLWTAAFSVSTLAGQNNLSPTESTKPTSLVLSDIITQNTPGFIPIKQNLVLAYERIGIDIEWITVPTERALKYSNEGRFDGEFLRTSEVVEGQYEQLVKVPELLVEASAYLFCLTPKPCRNINSSSILVGYNNEVKLYKKLCEKLHLACQGFYPYGNPIKPLVQDKVDAYIASEFELAGVIDSLSPILYQSKPIVKAQGYHYLHKDVAFLIPELLAEFSKMKEEGLMPDHQQQIRHALQQTGKIKRLSN